MPKYRSFMEARIAIISKYNSIYLTGQDWFDFLEYATTVASRYMQFIYNTTGIVLPFGTELVV